jgi:transposase
VIPLIRQLGDEFIFMHDNAPCHRAITVSKELDVNNIMHLPWPPRSPEINPIEHAWHMLGRAINNMPNQPQTLFALESALKAHWNAIPQNDLNRLIASVKLRVQMCIDAAGGHTHY